MLLATNNYEANVYCNGENGIVSEMVLSFFEDSEITEGMCTCVCITKGCSGCILQ